MKTITKVRLLNKLHLFNIARDLLNKQREVKPQILNFFSQFIQEGDLCFDIGSNIGQFSDIFLQLNGKVVVVEPQAECTQFLKRKYKSHKNVIIINKAIDNKEGKKDLYICEANALSSMSIDWIKTAKRMRYPEYQWDKKLMIETIRLDTLIGQFGKPKFCKIDIEGYELNALKGLTQSIPYLSIETSPETIELTKECILYLAGLGFKLFNHSSDYIKFNLNDWLDAKSIIKFIESIKDQKTIYGDLYSQS